MSLARVLCIVGPTGVGKSELADLVAAELVGEVVSVDSMQLYCGMDVGTAKVPSHKRICPLHMVDVAEVNESYSVMRFQQEARACVDGILQMGRVPVLCGGSGLYLDAVIDEMAFPPGKVGDEKRRTYELMAEERGGRAVYDLLCKRDPKSAGLIHPNNTRRVIRALELLDEGKSYYEHHKGLKRREAHYDARIWGLTMPREALYARIDARVDAMMSDGLMREVQVLDAKGIRTSSTASQAIGYRELLEVLDGKTTQADAIDLIKRNTRRYSKRQISWLKRDGRAKLLNMDEIGINEAMRIICDDWRQS